MSTLRAYVGSRDTAMKSPGRADQPRPQPAPDDDRVQAKLHEMGFSNVQDRRNITGEAQIESQSKRQTVGDQHRIALTRTKLRRNFSVSATTNNRWLCKSTPASLPSAKDETESEQGLLRDPRNHRDPFDTDTENLDSTITLSEFGDAQALQAWPLTGKAAPNDLDQIFESEYFRGESLSSGAERRQRQHDDPSHESENNDLTRNEEEFAIDNGLDEINDEDAPDQGDRTSNGFSSRGLGKDLNSAGYTHNHLKEPTKIQAANAGSFVASPTAYKKLVMRNSGERSPDSVTPFIKAPWLDPGHTMNVRGRVTGTPYSFPKHDSSRPEDFRSNTGQPKSLEPDMPREKNIPSPSRQGYQHKAPAIGDSQLLMPQQSELQIMTARTLTPSEPPVSLMIRAYDFPNIPNEANREVSHDADDATYETHSRKRGIDLDYNPTQLREMAYERLRQESFDGIKPVQGAADQELLEKLQNVYDLKGSSDPHLKRRTFFSGLTIEQYEECGDLMVERFSDVIARYKVTRQQKRAVARAFEEEVGNREERVRAKKKVVDRDLGRLRKAGEAVVRGKGA